MTTTTVSGVFSSASRTIPTDTPTNFQIFFSNSQDGQDTIATTLMKLQVQNLFDNVYEGNNYFFYYIENLGLRELKFIEIAYGRYDIVTLVAALNAEEPTWMWTFGTDGRLSFTVPAGLGTIYIPSQIHLRNNMNAPSLVYLGPQPGDPATAPVYNLNMWMGGEFSVEGDNTDTVVEGGSYTFPYSVNLSGPATILLSSAEMAESNSVSDWGGHTNILGSLSLHNIPYGYLGHYQATQKNLNTVYYKETRNFNGSRFFLEDEQGTILRLPGNAKVYVEVHMTKVST